MILFLTLPIAIIDTLLLYRLMAKNGSFRSSVTDLPRTLNASLMRFTFASQLVVELLSGSKVTGCIFSFAIGLLAGYLTVDDMDLSVLSDLLMNVFMGISMGIFLIGHMPLTLTILLIAPIFLSSGLTFLHNRHIFRRSP